MPFPFSSALKVCLVLLPLAAVALPFDLGFGGVYSDDNSQAYFAERFGRGFFASLASRFRSSGAAAATRRQQAAVAATTEVYQPVFVSQSEPRQQQPEIVVEEEKGEEGAVPLYRDAVPAPTAMKADDIQPALKQDDLDQDGSSYYYYEDNSSNSYEDDSYYENQV